MDERRRPEVAENEINYFISPGFANDQLNELYAASWPAHSYVDFDPVLSRGLAYVCAYSRDRLVGFVYLAWDGGRHAFLLDTTVHPEYRRRGIGVEICKRAVAAAEDRGVEWVHVDFEPHLREFYSKCGFRHTDAGLIRAADEK
jgi:GNAT superfamily N-acetyltransferase